MGVSGGAFSDDHRVVWGGIDAGVVSGGASFWVVVLGAVVVDQLLGFGEFELSGLSGDGFLLTLTGATLRLPTTFFRLGGGHPA